jgi:spore germination cell wall hydrolase CwlJ-like protein
MEISLKKVREPTSSLTKFIKTISLVLLVCTCTNFTVNAKTLEKDKTKQISKLHIKAKQDLANSTVMKKQIDCLARNIYFESASEPYEGKLAVAQVTMNRVKSGKFPGSVCGVVYQRTMYEGLIVCQFSWTCEGNLKIRAPHLYEESRRVAKKFILDNYTYDRVKRAYYFHGDYINPGWQLRRVAHIGRHIFYAGAG